MNGAHRRQISFAVKAKRNLAVLLGGILSQWPVSRPQLERFEPVALIDPLRFRSVTERFGAIPGFAGPSPRRNCDQTGLRNGVELRSVLALRLKRAFCTLVLNVDHGRPRRFRFVYLEY